MKRDRPPSAAGDRLFSIGHSNHPIQVLLDLLLRHSVEVVADVRSQPRSGYSPQFDRESLQETVRRAGLKYVFLGEELGGRPEGEEFYDREGHVLYSRLAESPTFLKGIARLEEGMKNYRIAVLCSEENPTDCHRRLLIGRVLSDRRHRLDHIRGDGRVQTESELAQEAASRPRQTLQPTLFSATEETPWRSTRSASRARPPRSSSKP